MTTISIAYDVPAAAVARVESLLAEVAATDPNWNGADFKIERDDFTCIDARDEIAGAALLSRVFNAIDDRS